MTTKTLSAAAQTLYNGLKSNGATWAQNCVKFFHSEPKYIGTLDANYTEEEKENSQRAYWQWNVNLNGVANTRPVLGKTVLFEPTANYSKEVHEAYQELSKSGMAGEQNNGYNEYRFYAK